MWASGAGQIRPLGSMLGQHLGDAAEAFGLPLDPSSFLCQKCETILCPGFNYTIRIKKSTRKATRHSWNNVIYACHFCHHENLKRDAPKGTVKNLLASKPRESIDATAKIDSRCTLEEAATTGPKTPVPKMIATNDYNLSNSKKTDSSLSASNEVGTGSRKQQRDGRA